MLTADESITDVQLANYAPDDVCTFYPSICKSLHANVSSPATIVIAGKWCIGHASDTIVLTNHRSFHGQRELALLAV
jgi:hypothetical protein